MNSEEQKSSVRDSIFEWADAMRALDIDGVMAFCAGDFVIYDCHSAFCMKGAEAYRGFLEACFPHMQPPVSFEIDDLEIDVDGKVAFAHFTARCVATDQTGAPHASTLRATMGLRRHDDSAGGGGRWLVAHSHVSAPFDPETEKALLDLNP